MRARMAALLGVVAAVGALATSPARAQPAEASLRAGEVAVSSRALPGQDIRVGRAVAIVDAPIDTVMASITDYAHYRDFLPHFTQSRIVSGRGPNRRVYLQVSILRGTAEIWALARFFARASHGDTRIVEGRMMEGNVDGLWARWEVTPVDGGQRTRVAFEMFVDPSFPAPAGVVSAENARWAGRAVRALRERVQRRASL